jgi:hypothetical protein
VRPGPETDREPTAAGPTVRRCGRRAAGFVLAVLVTAGIAAASRWPYDAGRVEDGLLRFSWRFRSAKVEACRTLSPEELGRLPVHMRTPEVCEGRNAPYRLRAIVDGDTLLDERVRAAGAREDRPIYVHRELVLRPGAVRLRVTFEPVLEAGTAPPAEPLPARHLDATVVIERGRIVLVTDDPAAGALVVRTGEPERR